jgi:hypothetical protein
MAAKKPIYVQAWFGEAQNFEVQGAESPEQAKAHVMAALGTDAIRTRHTNAPCPIEAKAEGAAIELYIVEDPGAEMLEDHMLMVLEVKGAALGYVTKALGLGKPKPYNV